MAFSDIGCPSCGIDFKVPEYWEKRRRQDGVSFYCPNGHSLSYTVGPTEADKLRQERDRLKQQLAQKDDAIREARNEVLAAERRVTAQKGVVTKLKTRAKAGACPCCNRTFRQLTLHMKHKHPGFKAEAAE